MSSGEMLETDVLVIGGTAAGCSAAIAAARRGASVIILEPTSSIGGITANGVHCFDTGSLQALSGIAKEFVGRVLDHYSRAGIEHPMLRSKADVPWEFHVAERIWREMMAGAERVRFINGAVPVSVTVEEHKVAEVQWECAIDGFGNLRAEADPHPRRVRAGVVIDATYEGDVAAWAGAPFDLGREGRSAAEPHAGHIFTSTLDRKVDANGYLPATILPGSTGAADDSLMAFTCRLSLRYRPLGFEPYLLKTKPDGYDSSKYAWRPGHVSSDGNTTFGSVLIPSLNGKMLTNQRHKGDDILTGNREFILAHPRERGEIRKGFYDHVLGFLYFIQTEGGMPQLGLAEDEYIDNGNIPHVPYIREGRRFRARKRMTEADVNAYIAGMGPRPPRHNDSIAIGDWAIESRRCSDEIDPETQAYEGAMFPRAVRSPYQVPYACLVPEGIDNLLVTTTISASHVAFCALRVEAVWTETGTAAGLAASMALKHGCKVADVPVRAIQDAMVSCGCKLTYFADVESSHPHFAAIQWLALQGFVPNDRGYRFFPDRSATWGDAVEAAALAFDLPISVTGLHFEGLEPGDAAFRYAETLYDIASQAGVGLFPNMRYPAVDAPADYLKPEARSRWLTLEVDSTIMHADLAPFLKRLAKALNRSTDSMESMAHHRILTRGELASLVVSAAGLSRSALPDGLAASSPAQSWTPSDAGIPGREHALA